MRPFIDMRDDRPLPIYELGNCKRPTFALAIKGLSASVKPQYGGDPQTVVEKDIANLETGKPTNAYQWVIQNVKRGYFISSGVRFLHVEFISKAEAALFKTFWL